VQWTGWEKLMSGFDSTVAQTELPLTLLYRGKVRDIYEVDDEKLLMVASDRVSAFDIVMEQPIPRKGEVLTQITAWWLDHLSDLTDHHLISVTPGEIADHVPALEDSMDQWARRSMLVRRTKPVLIECVVRGYVSGSAWREYRDTGTLAGEPLPPGLVESDRLDPPIFSPATKAQQGEHDENITFGRAREELGAELADGLRSLSLAIYGRGVEHAHERGIILADTKFEFGHDSTGNLLLIDEVLTPDSSRFWPAERYQPGRGQPSLDKQPIRDFLDELDGWDKRPPPPELPDHVVDAATTRYLEIFRRLTGVELNDYRAPRFD
jgi:phosphoribosylaminoimidazole-succinocarboxamide synthase